MFKPDREYVTAENEAMIYEFVTDVDKSADVRYEENIEIAVKGGQYIIDAWAYITQDQDDESYMQINVAKVFDYCVYDVNDVKDAIEEVRAILYDSALEKLRMLSQAYDFIRLKR